MTDLLEDVQDVAGQLCGVGAVVVRRGRQRARQRVNAGRRLQHLTGARLQRPVAQDARGAHGLRTRSEVAAAGSEDSRNVHRSIRLVAFHAQSAKCMKAFAACAL